MPDRRSANLPFRTKLIYGFGQMADSLGLNGIKQIGHLFYVVLLGVSPATIGALLAIIRLWDSILDPLVGSLSDRLASRFGRRKPFMLVGTLLMVLLFPVPWMAQNEWSETSKILWFGIVLMFFSVGYTCYAVAFQAMGLEITRDHHQRTGVQAFRTFFGSTTNILLSWALPLAFIPFFKDEFQGMIWIACFIALFILMSGILPITLRAEDSFAPPPAPPRSATTISNWRSIISSRPFVLLLGTMACTFLGLNLTISLAGLLNVYYVYGGDVGSSMVITGTYGTLWTVTSVATTFVIPLVSRRWGKRISLFVCLLSIVTGSLSYLWVFDPEIPFLQLIPVFFISPGCAGLWILGPSMLADVCDDHRVRTGTRREASFSAVYSLVQKIALSTSFALSGFLTVWSGFEIGQAADQADGVFDTMRMVLAISPILVLIPGLVMLSRFPITESIARENSRLLSVS